MDDLTRVRAGMELLAWEYDADTWSRLVRSRRAHRRTLGMPAEELDAMEASNPGRVLFTSTGVLYGANAWPWRTGSRSLGTIELIFGGWRALQLTFVGRWGARSDQLLVPLPPAVASDAIAMVKEDLLPRAAEHELIIIGAEGPEHALFDPADDPVARDLDWAPLKPGGHDYPTHELVRVSPDRFELRSPGWHQATAGTIAAICAAAGGAAAYAALPAMALCFGGAACIGLWLVFRGESAVFDRERGFWLGGRRPPASGATDLERIYALQLVSEVVTDKQTFVSWELNLVLEDGRRINVVDHADYPTLHEHAETLAKFLHVPLWQGV